MGKKTFFAILTLLVILVAGFIFANKSGKCLLPQPEKVTVSHETTVADYNQPATIQDVLVLRNNILDQMYYDSVFYHMPEPALIAILMKYGTDMSNYDIGREYIMHKADYDKVELGATIQKTIIEPDTLPESLKPEKEN